MTMVSSTFWQAPVVIVWLIGIMLADIWWRRHPQVSAAVLIAMGLLLASAFGQFVIFPWAVRNLQTGPYDAAVYFAIISAIGSLVRAVSLAAMLMAALGWRSSSLAPGGRRPMQFSIAGLLTLTLVAAVLCGVVRGMITVLGESTFALVGLLDELPVVICWLFGAWLAWTRRAEHPQVTRCIAIAIGLQAANLLVTLCLIVSLPTFGTMAIPYIVMPLFSLVSGALSWGILLTAAFGWRTTHTGAPGSPFRKMPA